MTEKFLVTIRITRDVVIEVDAASRDAATRQIRQYGLREATADYRLVGEAESERLMSCIPKDPAAFTEAVKAAQGKRCSCHGTDDLCPCQNVWQP